MNGQFCKYLWGGVGDHPICSRRHFILGAQEFLKTMVSKLANCTYHLADDPEVIEQLILQANPNYKIIHTCKKLFASVWYD